MPRIPVRPEIGEELLPLFEEAARSRSIAHGVSRRMRAVLLCSQGLGHSSAAQQIGLGAKAVRLWSRRWQESKHVVKPSPNDKRSHALQLWDRLLCIFQDLPRSGAPARIANEEVNRLTAISCKCPNDYGLIGTVWTHAMLSTYASKLGIKISPSHYGRILRNNGLKPNKSQYWLFPKITDEEAFITRIESVCGAYRDAVLLKDKVAVSCSDEKTSIQAIKHLHTQEAAPGKLQKIDPEYERNGTSCLIASRNVLTGQVNAYSLSQTRTQEDYLNHVKQIVATEPVKKHIIVCDQLNTHKSEVLVRWIAEQIGFEDCLGEKGKSGILQSQETRMQFLEDKSHSIQFIYTPKHCSWMNQIENWFGLLERKLIKRGEFTSVDDLNNKIKAFIKHYNEDLATPYKWKFNGEKYRAKFRV